jgi:surface antigen
MEDVMAALRNISIIATAMTALTLASVTNSFAGPRGNRDQVNKSQHTDATGHFRGQSQTAKTSRTRTRSSRRAALRHNRGNGHTSSNRYRARANAARHLGNRELHKVGGRHHRKHYRRGHNRHQRRPHNYQRRRSGFNIFLPHTFLFPNPFRNTRGHVSAVRRVHNHLTWLGLAAIGLVTFDHLTSHQRQTHATVYRRASTTPIGETVRWRDGNTYGSVTATRDGTSSTGRYCREYRQSVSINGKRDTAYGVACQRQDGSWEMNARAN